MPTQLLIHRLFPWLVLIGCTMYAVVRYLGFGDVAIDQLPAYLANKATSFAGLIVLAASRLTTDGDARRRLGLFGAACVLVHLALSLSIMGPKYFPAFYTAQGLMMWQ